MSLSNYYLVVQHQSTFLKTSFVWMKNIYFKETILLLYFFILWKILIFNFSPITITELLLLLIMYYKQGHQNKYESGEAQRMDIDLHWQLPKAAQSRRVWGHAP